MELLCWEAPISTNSMGALRFVHCDFYPLGINTDLLDWSSRCFGNWYHLPHPTQRQGKAELSSTFRSSMQVDPNSDFVPLLGHVHK